MGSLDIFERNKLMHDEYLRDVLFLEDQLAFFRALKVRHIYETSPITDDIIVMLDTRIKKELKTYNKRYFQSMTRAKLKGWEYGRRRGFK